jgi:hypothetical protein
MRLIGAGLPRTATLSQKLALEQLGVGPCYHMVDVLADLRRVEQWADALEGNADWEEIFAGYDSTVDWPASFFYRELREAYPDAKVLLSVRPGEAWARSMRETIMSFLYGDSLMSDLNSARCRVDPGWRGFNDLVRAMWPRSGLFPEGGDTDEATLARTMERYNEQVQDEIDDVLVWSPGDGWEPLCELLEVEVPDAPFPWVNDSQMFEDRIIDGSLTVLNEWRAQVASPAGG